MVSQVLPLLRRPDYRVTLVVWATMPSDSAWLRAVRQAGQIAEELADETQLPPEARARLVAVGQPWHHVHFDRPVISLTITKTQ